MENMDDNKEKLIALPKKFNPAGLLITQMKILTGKMSNKWYQPDFELGKLFAISDFMGEMRRLHIMYGSSRGKSVLNQIRLDVYEFDKTFNYTVILHFKLIEITLERSQITSEHTRSLPNHALGTYFLYWALPNKFSSLLDLVDFGHLGKF